MAGVGASVIAAALLVGGFSIASQPPLEAAPAPLLAQTRSAGLSDTAARQAAERILEAVKQRDGKLRYSQFATALQKTSSPAMVQGSLDKWPQLESWTIESVRSGLNDNSSVEVELKNENGTRRGTLVINPKGQLVAQVFDFKDKKSTQVARAFMDAVTDGQFVTARSLLALELQKEISPSELQNKWLKLQRGTGTFQKIDDVMEADHGSEGTLVLVETSFNRVTDNIFVILNSAHEITGVDFPIDSKVR
ncbi:MAG: hypothetical protein CBB79_03430 [Synechococcus sp. TMED19]|nr:MAG: hypothetical protein CBB79_03430 [Synechococcus sp. TMED19]